MSSMEDRTPSLLDDNIISSKLRASDLDMEFLFACQMFGDASDKKHVYRVDFPQQL